MALQNLEMIVKHFKCANIGSFERNELEFDNFPKFDDNIDLFLHLCFVFSDFADLLNCFLVIEQSQIPKQFQLEILIDFKILFNRIFNFFPMSSIGSDHRLMF